MIVPLGAMRSKISAHVHNTMHPAGFHGDAKTRDQALTAWLHSLADDLVRSGAATRQDELLHNA